MNGSELVEAATGSIETYYRDQDHVLFGVASKFRSSLRSTVLN